jgi:hypothetical protein
MIQKQPDLICNPNILQEISLKRIHQCRLNGTRIERNSTIIFLLGHKTFACLNVLQKGSSK